ncbi:uncharacterized protein [Haliotis asinina]|uniref:uncharacterized protein n=1 Tax=Haliotis asinina TaxID=109174 RepID=UPI0035324445
MPLLVLLVMYMFLPQGQLAELKVVYGVGIKLCNVLCIQRGSCISFAYDIDRLACHLSHMDARHWTMGRSIIYPKQKDQMSGDACSAMNCELNTRCVERRGGDAVCVEGSTVGSTLESGCLTDSDCSADRKFVCFMKTCKCIPGYSFNPANNSCVRHVTFKEIASVTE